MTYKSPLLPLLLSMVGALPSVPALACIGNEPARDQIVLYESLAPRKPGSPALPQERTLRAGDLVSVLAPVKAVLTLVDEPRDRPQPLLLPLEEVRFRLLAAQGGGRLAPEAESARGGKAADVMSWRRFGAQGIGLVYIQVSGAGRERLIRLDVQPAKVIPRGGRVRGNETSQSEPLSITMFDTLELELPGAPGDGWAILPANGSGLKLAAVEAVVPAKADPAAIERVRLRFSQLSASGYETKLTVTSAGKNFSFIIRHLPIPTC